MIQIFALIGNTLNVHGLPLGLTFKSNFRSQSTNKSYQQNSKRPPTGYCFAYHNISQRCTYQNCTYKHTCPTCDQRHPMFRPCNQYQHQYQRQGQSTSGYVNKAKKNHQTKQTPNTPSVNRDQPPANSFKVFDDSDIPFFVAKDLNRVPKHGPEKFHTVDISDRLLAVEHTQK